MGPAVSQIIECLSPRFMVEDIQNRVAQCFQEQENGQCSSTFVDCQFLTRLGQVVLEHCEDMSVARLQAPRQLGWHDEHEDSMSSR